MKLRNVSGSALSVPGVGGAAPGDILEVEDEKRARDLLANRSRWAAVDDSPPKKRTKATNED